MTVKAKLSSMTGLQPTRFGRLEDRLKKCVVSQIPHADDGGLWLVKGSQLPCMSKTESSFSFCITYGDKVAQLVMCRTSNP